MTSTNKPVVSISTPVVRPSRLKPSHQETKPWLKNAGWAKEDPIYDEAMRLGAEWRRNS